MQNNHRVSSVLAVIGDPVAARALALLLQGLGYETKFVTETELETNNPLKGVELVILTPTPELSAERREYLMYALREASRAGVMSILKLVAGSGMPPGVENARGEYVLPWPCGRKQLSRTVEQILLQTRV